ncbi:MAG: hypothetical protein ACQERN_11870 [Thermodesulfobacteriota bacterium]
MISELKNVIWIDTIKVNLVRSVVAGFVWMIIAIILPMFQIEGLNAPEPWYIVFSFPLIMPIALFGVLLPFTFVFGKLGSLFPFGNLIEFSAQLIPILFVIPGDPIMSVMHKNNTNLIPTERYGIIEWTPLITVLKQFSTDATGDSDDGEANDSDCPFEGRILVDKETKVLGFEWPYKATAFLINKDWSVSTENDKDFGWIDVDGEIHKGKPFGGIDPKATLSGGNTGFKINGSSLWAKNEKIGDLVKW